ncbi:MAG TPA: UbiH/UbiF/VisC/COQ6 family ubiquinone biosynthesis hydroxylase [Woeseiaceae bacterium]|nr:UbiH/UbiF/VisC/COQ6 family ubiquinone biosynthesis hydroxylase [Woeseiaceae bacterium]
MRQAYGIVIAGAGIAGLTAAALLSQSGQQHRLKITVLDAGPRPVFSDADPVSLRVSAIATGSADLLASIGAWDSIAAARACAYDAMRVWDENSVAESGATLRFDAAEFAVSQLGFIVENCLVQHALLDVLDGSGVELVFDAPIRAIEHGDGQYSLRLEDGQEWLADLVIGADGARSFVRAAMGIETRDHAYGQEAVVAHLQPEKPHKSTAWQRFLHDGPLGLLPLADGRVSVVWSTSMANARRAMEVPDADFGALLTEASDRVLGRLELSSSRASFPLLARHAERYVLPGVALIGDAAHAIHPLAGQGANLGLQDAAKLTAVIDEALCNDEHPGDRPVLRRYERARRGANASMLHLMTALNRLFTTDSVLLKELRLTGMRLFNFSGPIREQAVRVALGARR